MNLLEAYVTELVGNPYFKYDVWWQKVKYDCEGIIGETDLFNKDKGYFKIGFKFYC